MHPHRFALELVDPLVVEVEGNGNFVVIFDGMEGEKQAGAGRIESRNSKLWVAEPYSPGVKDNIAWLIEQHLRACVNGC
jgi:hypothetical protein